MLPVTPKNIAAQSFDRITGAVLPVHPLEHLLCPILNFHNILPAVPFLKQSDLENEPKPLQMDLNFIQTISKSNKILPGRIFPFSFGSLFSSLVFNPFLYVINGTNVFKPEI